MESVYLEVLSNPRIGLISKKDDIVPLIEGFLEVDEGDDTENNLKTYLKEKNSNFTPNHVKKEKDTFIPSVVDNKSSEPIDSGKRHRTITMRLSDVLINKVNKRETKSTKKKEKETRLCRIP